MMTSDRNASTKNITLVEDSIESRAERSYIPQDLRESIKKASILLVPTEAFRKIPEPVFPAGTEGLLRYLKRHIPEEHVVNICVDDDEFREYSLFSETHTLTQIILLAGALPVFVQVLAGYVLHKILKSNAHARVRADITVVHKDGAAKRLQYDGPASSFEHALRELLDNPRPNQDKVEDV